MAFNRLWNNSKLKKINLYYFYFSLSQIKTYLSYLGFLFIVVGVMFFISGFVAEVFNENYVEMAGPEGFSRFKPYWLNLLEPSTNGLRATVWF